MAVIEFSELASKKKERDRIRRLVEEGKTPVDHYIEALEDMVRVQEEVIKAAMEMNEAHEELEREYEEYIAFLKACKVNNDDFTHVK